MWRSQKFSKEVKIEACEKYHNSKGSFESLRSVPRMHLTWKKIEYIMIYTDYSLKPWSVNLNISITRGIFA